MPLGTQERTPTAETRSVKCEELLALGPSLLGSHLASTNRKHIGLSLVPLSYVTSAQARWKCGLTAEPDLPAENRRWKPVI